MAGDAVSGARRRRRVWLAETKAAIVAEALADEVTLARLIRALRAA